MSVLSSAHTQCVLSYAPTEHFSIDFFDSIEMGKKTTIISYGISSETVQQILRFFTFSSLRKITCLAIRVFPAHKYILCACLLFHYYYFISLFSLYIFIKPQAVSVCSATHWVSDAASVYENEILSPSLALALSLCTHTVCTLYNVCICVLFFVLLSAGCSSSNSSNLFWLISNKSLRSSYFFISNSYNFCTT